MSGSDHTRWSEDLAAYMLGALEPREAGEFERHLESCERCQGEMRWFDPAVQTLSESVERQEPPPGLRAALMAEVRADMEPQRRPAKGRSWNWFARPAVAFAVLILAIALVAGYEIGKGGSDSETGGRTVLSTSEHGIDVKMVREGSGGTLHLANLRQLPSDKVLEAWVRREGTVEAVPALLVSDRKGQAETTIADMSGVDTVMVTEEPQGGSETPTGDVIVTMAVPQ
jgi:anti-sigma-K factor RskA